jgi:putative two-component system response regulator
MIGAQILGGSVSDLLRTGEVIAVSHHERWDGTGYPKGLKGEDIPLHGRIVAVADAFDALTTRRPYKEPLPPEKAFEIVASERGKHFDPRVVDAFLRERVPALKIAREYQDPRAEAHSRPGHESYGHALRQHLAAFLPSTKPR